MPSLVVLLQSKKEVTTLTSQVTFLEISQGTLDSKKVGQLQQVFEQILLSPKR